MVNFSLLKQTFKATWLLWTVMTGIMATLLVQFSSMEATQYLLFLIFYGMMAMIMPSIYILISANKLFAGQVDRGSMAYVLSTPQRRITAATTQMTYSILTIVMMFVVSMLAHIAINVAIPLDLGAAGEAVGIKGLVGKLGASTIVKLNISACACCLALGGVCYMFSAIFNLSKHSFGASGVVVGVSILGSLLAIFGAMMGNALKNIKYLSLFSFFHYESILKGTGTWIVLTVIALCVAAAAYAIGATRFCKKDLPL